MKHKVFNKQKYTTVKRHNIYVINTAAAAPIIIILYFV